MQYQSLLLIFAFVITITAEKITPKTGETWTYKVSEIVDEGTAIFYGNNSLTRRITANDDGDFSCFDRGSYIKQVGWSAPETTQVFNTYSFLHTETDADSVGDFNKIKELYFKRFQHIDLQDASLQAYYDLDVNGNTYTFYVRTKDANEDFDHEFIWSPQLGLLSYDITIVAEGMATTKLTTHLMKKDGVDFDLDGIKEAIENSTPDPVSLIKNSEQRTTPVTATLTANKLSIESLNPVQEVSLFSPLGKVLYSKSGANLTSIPLTKFANGFWYLQVKTTEGVSTIPIVK